MSTGAFDDSMIVWEGASCENCEIQYAFEIQKMINHRSHQFLLLITLYYHWNLCPWLQGSGFTRPH